jgi:hypothetical protein
MIELGGHISSLRECVRLLNEATLLVRIDMSDLLAPLLRCRDVLAANPAPSADAVRRWIRLVEAAHEVARRKGPDAEMVLARLLQTEAILMQIRVDRPSARAACYAPCVQDIQE